MQIVWKPTETKNNFNYPGFEKSFIDIHKISNMIIDISTENPSLCRK